MKIKEYLILLKEFIALVSVILFFSGLLHSGPNWMLAFDYTSLLGKFGEIFEGNNFVGKGGGTSVRQAFLFSLSIIPGIMLSLGVMGVAIYFGALNAASKLLTYIIKPLLGLKGSAILALTGSLQSSDTGAILTRDLYERGLLSYKERSIFCAFQFSSGASIGVYMAAIPMIAHFLTVKMLFPLMIILIVKILGTNVMRYYLHLKKEEEIENDRVSVSQLKESKEQDDAKTPIDAFIKGTVRGWQVSIRHMMPNVIMAYVLITMLTKCGIMDVIGDVCAPLMQLFNLPGKSIAVLVASWLSGLGGVAVALAMHTDGSISARELTVLTPAIFLLGAQLQYMGRILAVVNAPLKHYKMFFAISILNAIIAMFLMNILV